MTATSTTAQSKTDETFDIRNFLDKLTPSSGSNRYYCPNCGGSSLTVNQETGAYQCWKNHCEKKGQICKILSPGCERSSNTLHKVIPSPKKTLLLPVAIPPNAKLVRLTADASPCPQPQQMHGKPPEGIPGNATETLYHYSNTQWVVRYQWPDENEIKGYSKTIRQWHRLPDGKPKMKKGDKPWRAYRLDEVMEAAKQVTDGVPALLWQEGEKCVEIARHGSIASLTLQGSAWGKHDIERVLLEVKGSIEISVQVLLADPDEAGRKKADVFSDVCAKLGMPCVVLYPSNFCQELPFEQSDIEQILAQMDVPEFIRRLEENIHASAQSPQPEPEDNVVEIPDSIDPNVTFLQQALNFLYGDKHWISADDRLYYHTGTYYKLSEDCDERARIASYCNSYSVADEKGNIHFPYAKPSKVREVLQWIKDRVEVNPKLLNPSGINCTNGVIKIRWENNKPVKYLEPHSPQHFFTYEPLVKYDPDAPTQDCDRLLQCLDIPQQQVILRNLAASIDIESVRKFRGREVRVILACGLGSNGKDSLREVVSTIYGHQGMTSVSLADFANYDDGRKFALAPLMYSRVNWASENPQTARLDKIQSLKLFATGNKLHSERKGKDYIEFNPLAVGLFNLNDVPSFQGTIQAIVDRIAAVEFTKTFKINPDPNNPNELQADPRFAYDSEFIRTSVAPAFLNKILDALEALIEEGIDYDCTLDAFKTLQKENNHLFQFCEDVGMSYSNDLSMTANQIWLLLEQWYVDNGTLTIEQTDSGKQLRSWIDQVRPSDKNVKGINQVIPRFAQLFPKAQKSTRYCPISKRNVPILIGVGLIDNTRTTIDNNRTTTAPRSAPETTQNQGFRTTRSNFASFEKMSDENKSNNEDNELDNASSNPKKQKSGAGSAETSGSNTFTPVEWCGAGAKTPLSGAATSNNNALSGVEESSSDEPNRSLMHMMIAVWENATALGKMILAASEEQLKTVALHCNQQQITHIKNAANSVWTPGLNRDVDYAGERCEVINTGFGREITIQTSGGSKLKIKRGNLRPWLSF